MSCWRWILVVGVVSLCWTSSAWGRQGILTGSFSVLQEYDSNINLTDDGEEEAWYTVFSPSLIFTSLAQQDRLSLAYAPALRIDQSNDETEVDHHLTVEGDKQFSSRWSGEFKESYIRSNDYTYYVSEFVQQEGEGISLSDRRRRREYWTNGFSVASEYEYAQESVLGLGYGNQILENDAPEVDDYVKHHPYLVVSHRLNQFWTAGASYDYIYGDFDNEVAATEDLSEHLLGLNASYQATLHDLVFASYQYADLDYDGNRSDYQLHRADLGWQRALGPHDSIAASLGGSYADREDNDSETGFNYSLDYIKEIKRGAFRIGGKGGMDELQFDADVDDGLSRFWSVEGTLDYQLLEQLSSQVYASVREDDFFEATPDFKEQSYVLGSKLSYALWRWYALSLGYSYRQLDSDLQGGDYQDHRAYVELSVGKELARWL